MNRLSSSGEQGFAEYSHADFCLLPVVRPDSRQFAQVDLRAMFAVKPLADSDEQ
jgi:hypothetical protein